MICLECKPSIEIGRKFIYKKGDWQRLTPPVKQTLWDLAKVYHTQRTLQHCRLSLVVVVQLISLSMCAWRGEVLDISIIGLAIGGHVHMLPHLSSHTTAPGLVGFDCQLYVTTHSRLWWDFGRYGYPATFPSLNNDYVAKKFVFVYYIAEDNLRFPCIIFGTKFWTFIPGTQYIKDISAVLY